MWRQSCIGLTSYFINFEVREDTYAQQRGKEERRLKGAMPRRDSSFDLYSSTVMRLLLFKAVCRNGSCAFTSCKFDISERISDALYAEVSKINQPLEIIFEL